MNSKDIIELLRKRHDEDVFHTEVSIHYGSRRMDAWAMKKSWSKPVITAYEVKVSRADFLQDHKLQDYLPYCNEMYLVCPIGVVKEDEIPEGFGLLVVSSTGNRLMTKKKSAYRQVEIEEQFYRGLLMSKVDGSTKNFSPIERELERRIKNVSDYTDYVEGKKQLEDLGYDVLRKFKNLQDENKELEKKIKAIETSVEIHEKIRKLLGQHYDICLRYGDDNILEELISEKLNELGNPEKLILKTLELAKERIEEAKRILQKRELKI